jgi:hypothetical protein
MSMGKGVPTANAKIKEGAQKNALLQVPRQLPMQKKEV